MAEKDKVFYWLKLKKDFMTSDTVDFLMSQQNGAEYVVLYQMLILKTINTDGVLGRQIGEVIIPFDPEKICRDCKWFKLDTVVVALELYKKLGLVYKNNDGLLQIADFENLVGSETYWAKQKRLSRQEDKLDNVQQLSNECPKSSISISLSESISNNLESNDNNIKEEKHKYGEYHKVLLKDSEIEKLKTDYPEDKFPSYKDLIKYLDEYIEMKGYKAKSHYLVIKKWVVDACKRGNYGYSPRPQEKKQDNVMDILKNLHDKYKEEDVCL